MFAFLISHPNRCKGFPGGSVVKNPPAIAGDVGLISGSGGSPVEGNGNPLQYSGQENPTDRGAWWATVHRVKETTTKSKVLKSYPCFLLSVLKD